jgi:glycosyltransferase involved in cell wall biosynthesis
MSGSTASAKRRWKLGVVMSHPTQYHSQWFRELASLPELEVDVSYCFRPDAVQQGADFGVPFEWDVSLLDGYSSRFLTNVAKTPGFHFSGCDTPEIGDVIADGEYDAVLINGWQVKSYWQAMRACLGQKIPIMVRGDSNLIDKRPLHIRIAKKLTIGRWIPRFAAYLTVGTLNARYYEYYGADKSKFFPVRHFVDNHAFATGADLARRRLSDVRAMWSVPTGALVVLFAGKFIEIKRPMDVIRAVERRARAGDEVHLLMVGDGALKPECQRYALEHDVPVSFTGFLNQQAMPNAYACSDVLVLSSASETWGLVVNEAMACGVSVIITDKVGCGPDLVTSEETGAIYPMGDVDALSDALQALAADRHIATFRGIRARERIAEYNGKTAASNTALAVESVARGIR